MKNETITILDFESVLVPEIWVEIAEHFGIEELHVTTRQIPDFDRLMRHRIEILRENNLKLSDLGEAIDKIEPLPGAAEFLNWLNERTKVAIISGSFIQFVKPFLPKLNFDTFYCHELIVDKEGYITGFKKRSNGDKKNYIKEYNGSGLFTIAVGDSYNDAGMLKEADIGILFNSSQKVKQDLTEFQTIDSYQDLKSFIAQKTPAGAGQAS